jgi:hypothetical protein
VIQAVVDATSTLLKLLQQLLLSCFRLSEAPFRLRIRYLLFRAFLLDKRLCERFRNVPQILPSVGQPNLGPTLAENFAEVKEFVRIRSLGSIAGSTARLIRHGDDAFYWDDIYAADESIFHIFAHDVLYGDQKTALADPSSVAIRRTSAGKYFGDINPIGELITLESGEQLTITLVFADLLATSHLKYDVLLSYHSLIVTPDDLRDFWWAADFTYVVMPENYSIRSFDAISDAIFARYMTDHGTYHHFSTFRPFM